MLIQPDLRPINRKEYKLFTDWWYTWEEEGTRCRTLIRAGFVTDIASIPKWAWWMGSFQPDGLHRAAAVWHDYSYQNRGIFSTDDPGCAYEEFDPDRSIWVEKSREFTRESCDRMFLKLMKEAGESSGTAATMFWAVRTFGWMAW